MTITLKIASSKMLHVNCLTFSLRLHLRIRMQQLALDRHYLRYVLTLLTDKMVISGNYCWLIYYIAILGFSCSVVSQVSLFLFEFIIVRVIVINTYCAAFVTSCQFNDILP